jgi:FK506-binding protein 4/5
MAGVEETMKGIEEVDEPMNELDDEPMDGLDDGDDEDDAESPAAMKVGEEKEIGKQGLKKKLLKEGEGWERPETGDEVEGTHLIFRAPNPRLRRHNKAN